MSALNNNNRKPISKPPQGHQTLKSNKIAPAPFTELQNLGISTINNLRTKPMGPPGAQISKPKKSFTGNNSENTSNVLNKRIAKPLKPVYKKPSLKKMKENQLKTKDAAQKPKVPGSLFGQSKKMIKPNIPLVSNTKSLSAGSNKENILEEGTELVESRGSEEKMTEEEIQPVEEKKEDNKVVRESVKRMTKEESALARAKVSLSHLSSPKSIASDALDEDLAAEKVNSEANIFKEPEDVHTRLNRLVQKLDFDLDASNLLVPKENIHFSRISGLEETLLHLGESQPSGHTSLQKMVLETEPEAERFAEPASVKFINEAPNTADSLMAQLLKLKNTNQNSYCKPENTQVTKRLSFSPEELALSCHKDQTPHLDFLKTEKKEAHTTHTMMTEDNTHKEEKPKSKSKIGKGPKKIRKLLNNNKYLRRTSGNSRNLKKEIVTVRASLNEKMETCSDPSERHESDSSELKLRGFAEKLGLDENYVVHRDSPVTKTYQKSLILANDLQSSLQRSIQAVEDSFDQTRKNFFALFQSEMPGFEDPAEIKIKPSTTNNKKASLKKILGQRVSICRSSIKSTGKLKKSECKKANSYSDPANSDMSDPSHLYADPEATTNQFSYWLEARRSGKLLIEEQEFTAENIRQVLKQELGFQEQATNEIECLIKVLNRQSCMYRANDARKKAIVYQGCALMSAGSIVYVHSSIKYMADQIQGLSPALSGACITNLVSREKVTQILDLFKNGQLKILYITPEKIMHEDILSTLSQLNISLVCLDEAHCVPEISPSFRTAHFNLSKTLKSKLRSIPILAFVPPVTYKICEQLCDMLSIPPNNVIPLEHKFTANWELSISRDEDKLRTLISLLKSPKFKQLRCSMIVYTECRKSAEDVTGCLLQNGHRAYAFHSGKTEIQKLETLNNFVRNNGGIIVTTSNTEIGVDKGLINCVIHFTMPKNLEIYVQDISMLHDQATCHLFLHDDDYHKHRQTVLGETIEKEQIDLFLNKVFELPKVGKEKHVASHNSDVGLIRGKAGGLLDNNGAAAPIHRLSSALEGFVKKKENVPTRGGFIANANQAEDNLNNRLEEDGVDADTMYSVKVPEMCQALDLKKEQILQLFEKFEQSERWLEFHGVVPVNYTARFTYERMENLIISSPLAKAIVERGKKINGVYKFVIMDLINHLKCSASDILFSMKELHQEGFMNYESNEEAFCFKILFKPNPQRLRQEAVKIAEKICKRNEINLKKLDFFYTMAKSYSFPTMEHLYKQSKIENAKALKISLQNQKPLRDNKMGMKIMPSIPGPSIMTSDSRKDLSANKSSTTIGLTKLFEKYLNLKSKFMTNRNAKLRIDEEIESLWEGQGSIENELPLMRIQTIRDKSTLMTDIQPLIAEFYEEISTSDCKKTKDAVMALDLEVMAPCLVKKVFKTLQGLCPGPNNKDLKGGRRTNINGNFSTNPWEKYSKYDPKDLYGVVVEGVNNFVLIKSQSKMK